VAGGSCVLEVAIQQDLRPQGPSSACMRKKVAHTRTLERGAQDHTCTINTHPALFLQSFSRQQSLQPRGPSRCKHSRNNTLTHKLSVCLAAPVPPSDNSGQQDLHPEGPHHRPAGFCPELAAGGGVSARRRPCRARKPRGA